MNRAIPTLLCLFALACQPNTALPVESKHLIGLTLDAPGSRFPVDSALQLKSFAHLADGSRVDVTSITEWTSSQPSIAKVGPTGIVSLIGVGTSRIEGRYDDRLVVVSLDSTAATLESLELSASSEGLLALGDSRRFQAIGLYSDGSHVDVSHRATWRGDALQTSFGASDGMVIARQQGMGFVAALFGGREAVMNVEVTHARMTGLRLQSFVDALKPGQVRQLRLFAKYSDGSEREVTAQAHWSSDDAAIEFQSQPGLVLARSIGHSVIVAEWDGVTASINLAVRARRLLALELDRTSLSIAKGFQQEISVHALFDDGAQEEVSSGLEWSSTDLSIVSAQGNLISSHAEGNATLTVSFEGMNASIEVNVTAPIVVRVTPTFAGGRMLPGQTTSVKVFGEMSDGDRVNLTSVVRLTHGAGLYTEDLSGSFELRAVSVGMESLTIEYGQLTHVVHVDVTSQSVSSIAIVDATPAVFPGPAPSAHRFRAMATWSDGALSDVSELGSWWIDDASVAELFDDAGRRGRWTPGRGGKGEVHFEHVSQSVMLSFDFP
ncbi:MAG: hypothetical protein QM817_18675 [Archangium sp.]